MRAELERTLSPGLVIERELGGGGMAHVFVAREIALDRLVVVKVLPPSLAGASLERFRREIQLAAALQHPHIVPVHTAGEAGGFLFYTMPYIQGESLRYRLGEGEPLPVPEVVRVLRDVASALAYAHAHGVVHRDIKPDNVLMSGDHAVVTDFGVAKALAAATRSGPRNDTGPHSIDNMTAAGVAVGTPAYMAPEQAAGDPDTDHRADLYAIGLLGYELLTGRSPFAARSSPHELITAQLVERPRPVDELRADVPSALADLVMQCLEKRPEDRPADAGTVREALDAVLTPSGGFMTAARRPRTRARRIGVAAGVLVAVAAAGLIAMRARSGPALDADLVAVVPFQAPASAELRYLREGMMDLFAARLTGDAGSARAADPRAVLQALRRDGLADTGQVPRERALALAEQVGAGQLLLGEITGTSSKLTMRATLLDVRDGRARAQAAASGPADSVAQLVDRLAVQLLAMRAGESARLTSLTSQSFPAIRSYLAGLAMYRHGRYQAAGTQFARALAADSTFALAGLGLTIAANWYGDHQQSQFGANSAWAHRTRLSPRDRALLEATVGPNFPAPSNGAQIIAARARYRDLAPERAEAWFEYGDALFHFGFTVDNRGAHVDAMQAFGRALAIDSTFSPALEHMVLLAARAGDTTATRRYARLYLAADSASDGADGVRWRLAVATRDVKTLDALAAKDTALPPPSRSAMTWIGLQDGVEVDRSHALLTRIGEQEVREGRLEAYFMMADVALIRGRPQEADALLDRYAALRNPLPIEKIKAALVADGSASAADVATGSLRAAFESGSPPPAAPPGSKGTGVQCLVPLWQAVAHDDTTLLAKGSQRLRAMAATEDSVSPLREYAIGCALIQEAVLATRARAPDARTRVARADSIMKTGPASGLADFGNVLVSRLWERQGEPALALQALRRRNFFWRRSTSLGATLREEGRLALATSDAEGAAKAWRHFLALRAGAEPALAREADGIRAELARLERRRSDGR